MHKEWQTVTLLRKEQISADTVSLQFQGKHLEKHIPGQFYVIKIPTQDFFVTREYSLSNEPNTADLIEFGVQKVENGIASNYLHNLEIGLPIEVKGPLGQYFNWDSTYKGHVVYIAGGSGIVPFMSMIRNKPENTLTLIASMKTLKHFSYFEELKARQKHGQLLFLPTLTRENNNVWDGRQGRIDTKLLDSVVNTHKEIRIFVCGRSSFVEDIFKLLLTVGMKEENIQRERFG